MSVNQYFNEVQGVLEVLSDYVNRQREGAGQTEPFKRLTEEEFTAIWQAAELLARGFQVLLPMMQLELSRQALNIPDPYDKPSGLIVPEQQDQQLIIPGV